MAYITQAQLEARLGKTLTTDQASYFSNTLLPGIQSYIEEATDTFFGMEGATETEIYVDGTDSRMLIIPTMVSVGSLKEVADDGTETLVDQSDYIVYPRTGPILALRKRSGSWNEGFENYLVTGIQGYAEVPASIQAVALELAVNDMQSNVSLYKSERVGDWSATYRDSSSSVLSDNSLTTLQSYRRLSRSV